MKIKSVVEFIEWKHDNFEPRLYSQMFRGQLDSSWSLLPSIACYAIKLSTEEKLSWGLDDIWSLECRLIEQFEKFALPFKDYRPASPLEKLVHAQHYGLPTRLLDWTKNPLKALYYAVDNPELDHTDGIIYGAIPEGWGDGTQNTDLVLNEMLIAFFPEMLNERINAQEGCFISFPLSRSDFNVKPLSEETKSVILCSIQIDGKHKQEIRLTLSELGINYRTINPGLEGVAKWVKSDFSNFRI